SSAKVEIAGGVHGDRSGTIQFRLSGGPIVAAESSLSIPRDSRDHALRNLANAVPISNECVTAGVHRSTDPERQLRLSRGAVIAAVPSRSVPGDNRHNAGG